MNKDHAIEIAKDAENESVMMSENSRFHHTLMLGLPGMGKTFLAMLPMIRQDMAEADHGIVVFDPDGHLAKQVANEAAAYGRQVILFDPSPESSVRFNPFIGTESEVINIMKNAFCDEDDICANYTMEAAVKVLMRLDQHNNIHGKFANFEMLSNLLSNSAGIGRNLMMELSQIPADTEKRARENTVLANFFLNEYYNERSLMYEKVTELRMKVFMFCNNEVNRNMNPDPFKGEVNDLDFKKQIRYGNVICLSTGCLRHDKANQTILNRLLVSCFQNAMYDCEDRTCKTFAYFDEFQKLAFPEVLEMMKDGEKLKLALTCAMQSLTQVPGHDDFRSLLVSKFRNYFLFPISFYDAEFFETLFGSVEDEEMGYDFSSAYDFFYLRPYTMFYAIEIDEGELLTGFGDMTKNFDTI